MTETIGEIANAAVTFLQPIMYDTPLGVDDSTYVYGAILRGAHAPDGDAFSGYCAGVNHFGTDHYIVLCYRAPDGTDDVLASAPTSAGPGDTFGIYGKGSTLWALVNGVEVLHATDTRRGTGYAGMFCNFHVLVDNFAVDGV